MRTVILDGRRFTDRPATHDYLQSALELPPWYGRNLDALADCLGEWGADSLLVLTHPEAVEAQLGDYGATLLELLQQLGNRPGGFVFQLQK